MEKTIKTRLSKGGEPFVTQLTIDFTGISEEQLHELAARSVIIATQAAYRTAESVPAHDTVVVTDMLKRERVGKKATAESVAKQFEKLTPAEKAQLLERLMAE